MSNPLMDCGYKSEGFTPHPNPIGNSYGARQEICVMIHHSTFRSDAECPDIAG